jgi:hypothetical protein
MAEVVNWGTGESESRTEPSRKEFNYGANLAES